MAKHFARAPQSSPDEDSPSQPSDEPTATAPSQPSAEDAPPRRQRKSRRVLAVAGAVLLALSLVAGGVALAVRSSVKRGRQAFQESMQKKLEQSSGTVQYDGHTYALNENMVTVAFIGFDNRTTSSTSGNEVEGQSDSIIVVALDTETGELDAIIIPRDSMVPVDMYVGGDYAGQATMQICLQYSYGSTPEQSSQLVAQCASRVLDGIPVDYYFTLNVEGVAPINDAIGGVTVVPTQSVDETDIVEGQQITLMGKDAQDYVQYRNTSDPDSALKRQERQVSYLRAFMDKVLQAARTNPALLVELYRTALNYTWTNLELDEFSFLATTILDKGVTSVNVVSLKGEMGSKDNHAAFMLDQDDIEKTVIDTFYHQADTDETAADGAEGATGAEE